MILGLGVGSLEEEFALLGAPFADRGRGPTTPSPRSGPRSPPSTPSTTGRYYRYPTWCSTRVPARSRAPCGSGDDGPLAPPCRRPGGRLGALRHRGPPTSPSGWRRPVRPRPGPSAPDHSSSSSRTEAGRPPAIRTGPAGWSAADDGRRHRPAAVVRPPLARPLRRAAGGDAGPGGRHAGPGLSPLSPGQSEAPLGDDGALDLAGPAVGGGPEGEAEGIVRRTVPDRGRGRPRCGPRRARACRRSRPTGG